MANDEYIDEPIEELQKAWREGEPGVTKGTKDLNQRARRAVDAVIERWDTEDAPSPPVKLHIIRSGTAQDDAITPVECQVG